MDNMKDQILFAVGILQGASAMCSSGASAGMGSMSMDPMVMGEMFQISGDFQNVQSQIDAAIAILLELIN